jgi:hypothetical protein
MALFSVTYTAETMEDLSKGLEEQAALLEDQIGGSNQRKGQLLRAEANGLRSAADIVRKTTITGPTAANKSYDDASS